MRAVLAGLVLAAGAPAGAQAAAPAVVAAEAALASASAERSGAVVTIGWEGLKAPVSVRLADRADMAWEAARPLEAGLSGRHVTVAAPVSPRPYFLVRGADGQTLVAAERVLPLAGGQNFRDLGGYRVADGAVRWGKLYRSGDPSGLTAEDLTYLSKLGITTVCDLRSTSERERAPSRLSGDGRVMLQRDYALDMAGFGAMFASGAPTADKARAIFAQFYRDLPFQFAGDYRAMFRALADGKAPLAFNCSAGKDRTGVGAALILTLLGADRETVVADYLLSNRFYRPPAPTPGAAADPSLAMFQQLPPEVVKVLMGVEPAYIEAALDAIAARPGGFEGYVRNDLWLTAADVAALRRLYVAPAAPTALATRAGR